MLWEEGDLHFNHESVPMINEDLGFAMVPRTKQELIDEFMKNPGSQNGYKYGFRLYLDYKKLEPFLPDAKYFKIDVEYMGGTVSELPQGFSTESMKTNLRPYYYPSPTLMGNTPKEINPHVSPEQSIWGAIYYADDNQIVNDAFIRVYFYDEQFNPIAQTIVVLTFDEDHVAEGYTPANIWQP